MKKILAYTLCIAMVLSMAACGKKEDPAEQNVGMPNPVVEYDSLQEIAGKLGVALMPIGGEENQHYSIISDETAQYQFTLDGIEYTYRANPYTYEDISGIHMGEGTAFENFHPGNDEPTSFVFTDEYKIARWFSEAQIQYILIAHDEGKLSESKFQELVETVQADTGVMVGFVYYDELEGDYEDSFSQRATMKAESVGWEGILITVNWGSSATETDVWEMWAKRSPDGLLSYNDGLHSHITFDEKGEENIEYVAEMQEGYFLVEDGKFLWTGAPDDYCRDCVFERIPE